MSPLEVNDPGLHDLIAPDAPIERVAGGFAFTEGPVWRGGCLLFSDIPNKRIARWRRLPEGPELTTYATGMSNGLTLDRRGQVLAAEHDGRRVTRVADNGTRTVLAERFQGKRLNSPNDIVVRSDGSIYFTDPPYGVEPGISRAVPGPRAGGPSPYRERSRRVTACTASPPTEPCTSWRTTSPCPTASPSPPTNRVLYIDDSAQKHIRAFSVRPDGTLDQWPHPPRHGVGRPGGARRPQGGSGGQRVLHGPRGHLGVPRRRRDARAHRPARAPRQPRVGRRRERALHHRPHQPLPAGDEDARGPARLGVAAKATSSAPRACGRGRGRTRDRGAGSWPRACPPPRSGHTLPSPRCGASWSR